MTFYRFGYRIHQVIQEYQFFMAPELYSAHLESFGTSSTSLKAFVPISNLSIGDLHDH
jgi:hypothetical protein